MPNWAFGNVKVTGTREGITSLIERFVSEDAPSTVAGNSFFARRFIHEKRQELIDEAMAEFENKAPEDTAEYTFVAMFAWSAYSCLIDGYPQQNKEECITLVDACVEDHVSVEIHSAETGMCFEEEITCDESGDLFNSESDLSRCKCRNCGEISHFGSFEDLEEAECPECGECGFDRCEEE